MKKCTNLIIRVLLCMLILMQTACGSIKGPKGDNGSEGRIGPQGALGSNGQDSVPITVVKLCQGNTAYPGTFTEVAFCLGGKLYAVYSANGGFESEIPPGTYNSNGINSSCTFTVGANCEVTW